MRGRNGRSPTIAAVDPASLAVVAVGYAIGSVDFGVIVPRLLGVDIYSHGSGNPGASNVLRSVGKPTAAAVVLGDIGKGLAAAALGDVVGGEALGFAAGLAAVVGHCWPLWHRLRGGKGVAAAGGMVLWMEPLLGLLLLVLWVAAVTATRRASVASLALAVAHVPGLAAFGHRGWSLAWASGVSAVIVLRHRANIGRLVTGSEHSIEGETP